MYLEPGLTQECALTQECGEFGSILGKQWDRFSKTVREVVAGNICLNSQIDTFTSVR